MRSNVLERRNFLASNTLTQGQLKLDATLANFSHEACNIENIAAMTLGSAVFKMARLGTLSLAGRSLSFATNTLSYAAALSAEVLAFRGANSLFERIQGRIPSESVLDTQGFLRTFTDFLALKGAGTLAAGKNIFLIHTLQSSAMVASRHLNAHFGFLPAPQGSLVEQFAEAEASNIAMNVGQGLFALMSGNRVRILEQSLEIGSRSILESSSAHRSFLESLTSLAREEITVMRADPSDAALTALSKHFTESSRQGPQESLQRIQEIVLEWFGSGMAEAYRKVEDGQLPKLPILRVLQDARFLGLLPDEVRIRLQAVLDLIPRASLAASSTPVDVKDTSQIYFMSGSADANVQMANVLLRQFARTIEQPPEIWKINPAELSRRLVTIATYYKNLFEKTQQERDQDFLTGLENRNALDRLTPKIEASLEHHNRIHERTSSEAGEYWVMMLDGDHFGQINLKYGEANGDRVLVHLAKIAQESVRELLGDHVFRLGGEEFLILLRNPGLIGVTKVAERIKQKLRTNPVKLELNDDQRTAGLPEEIYPTVSFGAAALTLIEGSHTLKTSNNALKSAIESADLALFEAKRRNRNQLVVAGKNEGEYLDEAALALILPHMPHETSETRLAPSVEGLGPITLEVKAARARALTSRPPSPTSDFSSVTGHNPTLLLGTLSELAAQETPHSHSEALKQVNDIVLGWFNTEMAEAYKQVAQGNLPQLALFRVLRDTRFMSLLPDDVRTQLQRSLDQIDQNPTLSSRPPGLRAERGNQIYFIPGSAEKNMQAAYELLIKFTHLMGQPDELWPRNKIELARHLAGLAYYFKTLFEATEKERDHDFLTGLRNPRELARLTPKIEATLDHSHTRSRDASLGAYWVLIVDGDNFKEVNDTYGHPNGDLVLKHYARVLRDSVRELNGDYVFRILGKKFLILFRSPTIAGVSRIANDIQERLRRIPVNVELNSDQRARGIPASISPTVSMGAAPLTSIYGPDGNTHVGTLKLAFDKADAALEHAKNTGKNRLYLAWKQPGVYLSETEIADLMRRLP